jgi:hypothetical protein
LTIAALPYTLLLLLTEFAVGGQVCLFALDARGEVTRGFVKMAAALAVAGAALSAWIAFSVPSVASVDSYPLDTAFLSPARAFLVLFAVLAASAAIAIWAGRRGLGIALGGATTLVSLLALGCVSAIVQGPTWSLAGVFLSLLAGGLALGGVTLAMSLGHWYLVTPRLPERPLNELTGALLAIFGVQALLIVVDVAMPARQHLNALGISLGQNPAFWLRIGVGLVLASLLTFMAWQSSRARGMMSATGLLYLATGAVIAGEALACSLLFMTAIPG